MRKYSLEYKAFHTLIVIFCLQVDWSDEWLWYLIGAEIFCFAWTIVAIIVDVFPLQIFLFFAYRENQWNVLKVMMTHIIAFLLFFR